MKRCFKCGETKPLDSFYAGRRMADGHLNKCKECTKADVQKNRTARAEQYSAYERGRFQRPRRKIQAAECQVRYRTRHPEKYKAHMAVGNAIRDGGLSRGLCEVCGSTDVQAHHDDYSRPLDVRWLCFKHHREEAHGQHVVSVA